VLFYVASISLVWLAMERMRPERAFAATLLFAWSPVLLYEGAGNGHIDVMMMFFALAAWCSLELDRPWLVLPLLMLSVLTKFVTLLLVPPFLWYTLVRWKERGHVIAVLVGGAGSLVLGALIYAPLWPGKATSVVESRQQYFTTSPATMLNYFYPNHDLTQRLARLVGDHDDTSASMTLARYTVYGIFGVCYAWYTWRAGRSRDDLLRSWCMILFSYLAVGVLWFQPWYLAWLVVPVALRPDDLAMLRRTIVFCVSSLAPYYTFYLWVATYQPVPWEEVMTWTTAVIFVPVLTVVLYDVARWWLRWDAPRHQRARLMDRVA